MCTFSWHRIGFTRSDSDCGRFGEVRSCPPHSHVNVTLALVHVELFIAEVKHRSWEKTRYFQGISNQIIAKATVFAIRIPLIKERFNWCFWYKYPLSVGVDAIYAPNSVTWHISCLLNPLTSPPSKPEPSRKNYFKAKTTLKHASILYQFLKRYLYH